MSPPQASNGRLLGSLDVKTDPLLSQMYSYTARKRKRIAAGRLEDF